MLTKGDEQGKKITVNTVAFKTHVPGWGLHKNLDRFFFVCRKRNGQTIR